MKLRYINTNGFGVLVDESANKNGYVKYEYDTRDGKIYETKNGYIQSLNVCHAIVFAEKELNLDVPVLPNWREWEVEQEALSFLKLQPQQILTKDKEIGLLTGFIAGYNRNKDKYTEEDIKRIIHWASLNEDVRLSEEEMFQSLQKHPKYIEVESEKCGYPRSYPSKGNHYVDENSMYVPFEYKLITNSESKQEGIIKEIIY
jgi:hypothetical protein